MAFNILDKSEKVVIEEPIKIGDDNPVTKYKAKSDGRTFWAYNDLEVFYEDERLYHALDEIARLKKMLQYEDCCEHDPVNSTGKYTTCKKCGMVLQMKP